MLVILIVHVYLSSCNRSEEAFEDSLNSAFLNLTIIPEFLAYTEYLFGLNPDGEVNRLQSERSSLAEEAAPPQKPTVKSHIVVLVRVI